jgi:hypothetical protein
VTHDWQLGALDLAAYLSRVGHTSVSLDGIVVRRPGRPTQHRPLDLGALGGVLEDLGAGLTADETARLAGRLRDLAAG